MTMGDESLHSAMTLPVVLNPILEALESKDKLAIQRFRQALQKAEGAQAGFSYSLVRGVLQKAEIFSSINYAEALLRLGSAETNDFLVLRREEGFKELNRRSQILKAILARIPDEIHERRKFLDTIREIASAIKLLLDAVGTVFEFIQGNDQRLRVDQRKREFVRYSKRFSTTLKDYFKSNQKSEVFHSANCLINQTNLIMSAIKTACS